MPNTCKSNGRGELAPWVSGGRVSNAWATYLLLGNNRRKRLLIPHNIVSRHLVTIKDFIGGRWARVRLASWWCNGPPRRRSVAGLRGRTATLGLRHGQTPTGGSSGEYCTMGASLMQQRRVREDGFRIVNLCLWWRRSDGNQGGSHG